MGKTIDSPARFPMIHDIDELFDWIAQMRAEGGKPVGLKVVIGGPGALFWLLVSGLLGMATKFAEIVLALTYREKDDTGTFRGGAMYILKNGLRAVAVHDDHVEDAHPHVDGLLVAGIPRLVLARREPRRRDRRQRR